MIVRTVIGFTAKNQYLVKRKVHSPYAITADKILPKSIYVKESVSKENPADKSGNLTVKHADYTEREVNKMVETNDERETGILSQEAAERETSELQDEIGRNKALIKLYGIQGENETNPKVAETFRNWIIHYTNENAHLSNLIQIKTAQTEGSGDE